jgi:hypothetical protein
VGVGGLASLVSPPVVRKHTAFVMAKYEEYESEAWDLLKDPLLSAEDGYRSSETDKLLRDSMDQSGGSGTSSHGERKKKKKKRTQSAT